MERGHRWPRMGSHPVVLNNCVGPQCALDWPQRQEPIRVAWCARRGGCRQGKSTVGMGGKSVPNCPIAANLPEAEHCWQQDEELTFPFPAKLNSADFSKGRHWFYRLRAGAQVAEGAQPAVHHQPWILASTVFPGLQRDLLLASSWQCSALRYQHSYSDFFCMLFV